MVHMRTWTCASPIVREINDKSASLHNLSFSVSFLVFFFSVLTFIRDAALNESADNQNYY